MDTTKMVMLHQSEVMVLILESMMEVDRPEGLSAAEALDLLKGHPDGEWMLDAASEAAHNILDYVTGELAKTGAAQVFKGDLQ